MKNDTNDFPVFKGSIEEIEVPKENPFENDKLNRKPYIKTLTNVVRSFQHGTVIALNGAWGTGKTTFIRMWKQYLENEHFPVAYYNAWEDDISEEPLFSLLRQLRNVANKKDGRKLGKVLKTGAKILGRITIAGAKASMGKVSEIIINAGEESAKEIKKIVEEAGKGGLDAIQGAFEDSLKNEKDDMQSLMKDFRKDFQSYVEYDKKKERDAVPFVYFIDELDRCNPTFAVKVLERIKHLFDVPNVVFIISVDKKQLELSINGFFGSEKFDSNEYLRRFIDVEYNMPHFSDALYYGCLEKKYGINQVLDRLGLEQKCKNYQELCLYRHRLIRVISNADNLSLRQLEKIFTLVQLMLCDESFVDSFMNTEEEAFFIPICFFMAYLKVCKNDIYQNVLLGSYSVSELSNTLEDLLPQRDADYSYYDNDYDYNYDLASGYDHDELCVLLVLAHYNAANEFERNRAKNPRHLVSLDLTSLDALRKIRFKRISLDLLGKYKQLFLCSKKSIFVWLDKIEMYQFVGTNAE